MEEMEFLLPKNIEAEQAVLGCILYDNEALDVAEEIVSDASFYNRGHGRIYRAMRKMREEGEPIDFVTLTAYLQSSKELDQVGGIGYLSQLANSAPTAANVAHYAEIVRERYTQRCAILEAKNILDEARKVGDPAQIAHVMATAADSLADQTSKGKDFKKISDVAMEAFDQVELRYNNKSTSGGVTGIPSGYTDLDNMTSGFQRSDLIYIAARPSVGKTALALNIAQNVGIRHRGTVGIFSLEMSEGQLVQRMFSSEQHIDAGRLRTGFLESDDWERLTMAVGSLADANIFIDDTPGISISEIRTKSKRLQKKHGLDLILIDYLQLITIRGRRDNRQQEVSEISRMLKLIARELNVPVIALSQLSRNVEQRQDKRPMMSDLRESGSLEQDADIVAFLYRDDYYDKESEKKNIIEVIIAKQRNGPVGTVELAFMKNFNKFVSLDRTHHSSSKPESSKRENEVPMPDMFRK